MRRARVAGWAWFLALGLAGCGPKTAPPPEPGTVRGVAMDLRGRRVMLLPVQQVLGVPGDPDAELAFGLRERGPGVTWILPSELEEALVRSPGLPARTRGLPVGDFLVAEVQRVGDPLYGDLRRLGALVDADAVLLPVQASLEPPVGGVARVRFWTALLEVRTGRVLWFSILEGGEFPRSDPRGLASAVEEVARALLLFAAR